MRQRRFAFVIGLACAALGSCDCGRGAGDDSGSGNRDARAAADASAVIDAGGAGDGSAASDASSSDSARADGASDRDAAAADSSASDRTGVDTAAADINAVDSAHADVAPEAGPDAAAVGLCQPDPCNGHAAACDPHTGACTCASNYTGAHCEFDLEIPNWPLPPDNPTDYTVGTDTVIDNVTGLEWQRSMPGSTLVWSAAKQYCRSLDLPGTVAGTWRLPTRVELFSIINYLEVNPAVTLAAFADTPSAEFWSSSEYYLTPQDRGWLVNFTEGRSTLATSGTALHVRCVRGPAALAPASGRYSVTTDVAVDAMTGLTWQRAYRAAGALGDARNNCSALDLGGFSSGWRVPRQRELDSLRTPRVSAGIDPTVFNPPGAVASHTFWSNTFSIGSIGEPQASTEQWVADYLDGSYPIHWSVNDFNWRCVR